MSEEMKALREQLQRNDKNGYDTLDEAQLAEMEAYCADYKRFLDAGKTERECAAEAVRLAEHWGADPRLARRAGILHDCTKYLDLDEQLALCEQYHVPLDDLERVAVKLLHSKTGAAIARHVFGEPEAVCNAIYWHTTGKADMDLLSKILYLADYIEPSRAPFEGLEELRRLAYTDMDKALLLGCEMTIEDMEERGVPVHTNTLQARDFLKGRT